jgi:hypothetical protein
LIKRYKDSALFKKITPQMFQVFVNSIQNAGGRCTFVPKSVKLDHLTPGPSPQERGKTAVPKKRGGLCFAGGSAETAGVEVVPSSALAKGAFIARRAFHPFPVLHFPFSVTALLFQKV